MTTTKSGDGSEALVLRVHPADAKFFSIVVYDWCMRSTEMREIDWRGPAAGAMERRGTQAP
jgi:hypothetical protein